MDLLDRFNYLWHKGWEHTLFGWCKNEYQNLSLSEAEEIQKEEEDYIDGLCESETL